jgi:hypothetical protein
MGKRPLIYPIFLERNLDYPILVEAEVVVIHQILALVV